MKTLEGVKDYIESLRKACEIRHKKMLENGYKVCPMCNANFTRAPVCAICYDRLMGYKKIGRLPKKLVPFAIATGLMKKKE